jgi:hypothetical protein
MIGIAIGFPGRLRFMHFDSVGPSAVRAIRQREILREWIRLHARQGGLPLQAGFEPARFSDEMPDLMFYDVEYIGGEPRYRVIHEGHRLIDAYGIVGKGRHLQDTVSPPVWAWLEPLYRKCVSVALPVYSAFHVTDREGRKVDYERLLLPFGANGVVRNMIASLKAISEEGRFTNTNLMRPVNHEPKYTLRAVIDTGLAVPSSHIAIEGDVVEL